MKRQLVRFEYKVLFCLWKAYFEKGYSLLNYFKYFLLFFGGYDLIVNQRFEGFLILGIIYFIVCVVLGISWYKTDMIRAEHEIGNRFNILAEELRKKFKLRDSKQR